MLFFIRNENSDEKAVFTLKKESSEMQVMLHPDACRMGP